MFLDDGFIEVMGIETYVEGTICLMGVCQG